MASRCREQSTDTPFTIALDGKFSTLDPIGSQTVDASSERIRTLMYNSLIKKDDKFDYTGDVAKEINPSEDGLSYTFVLNDNIKFQNGKVLDSGDVKYTLDTLFKSEGGKAAAFFETENNEKKSIIASVETPDAKTIIIKITRPELKNQLIPNLVPIAIIPKDAAVGKDSNADKNPPPGTGCYKFKSFDTAQNVVNLEAFDECWEGKPNIKNIRVKILADASALQAELQAGRVDLAPTATILTPDTLQNLDKLPNLKVVTPKGSNIQYLWFNTEAKPLDNAKVRQAIGYAINREKIINDVLNGKADPSSSLLPTSSWAYSPGTDYKYNPEKAKQLLDEAGLKDTNNDGMREMEKIILKISSSNKVVQNYCQVIQSQLKDVGVPLDIESLEANSMRTQVQQGQFIMTTGIWVGGNQDPIFLKDLFHSSKIPAKTNPLDRNRGRYKNTEVDKLLDDAFKELDKEKSKGYYIQAWDLISKDLPFYPLWYPNNVIVAKENIDNIQMNASGDWDFVKKMTVK